jgi:hypothetical protein
VLQSEYENLQELFGSNNSNKLRAKEDRPMGAAAVGPAVPPSKRQTEAGWQFNAGM